MHKKFVNLNIIYNSDEYAGYQRQLEKKKKLNNSELSIWEKLTNKPKQRKWIFNMVLSAINRRGILKVILLE